MNCLHAGHNHDRFIAIRSAQHENGSSVASLALAHLRRVERNRAQDAPLAGGTVEKKEAGIEHSPAFVAAGARMDASSPFLTGQPARHYALNADLPVYGHQRRACLLPGSLFDIDVMERRRLRDRRQAGDEQQEQQTCSTRTEIGRPASRYFGSLFHSGKCEKATRRKRLQATGNGLDLSLRRRGHSSKRCSSRPKRHRPFAVEPRPQHKEQKHRTPQRQHNASQHQPVNAYRMPPDTDNHNRGASPQSSNHI